MHRIIIFLFLLGLFGISRAQSFDFNSRCRHAYEEMMLFNFDKANKILKSEKQQNSDNLIPAYIEDYIIFWKAALNENADDLELYDEKAEELIDIIDDMEDDSPYKNFLLSDMYLRGAYLKLVQKSYLAAVYRFNKAYNLAWDNRAQYPDFIPNKKLIGLMNVGIGTVPKNYNWVLNLFNFQGNIKDGLLELNQLLTIAAYDTNYRYLMSESLLLYSFTTLNFEVSKESEQRLLSIFQWDAIESQIHHSQFMVFAKASFLNHLKQNDEAIRCMKELKPDPQSMHFYYLDYFMGECLLHKLDYSAAGYFRKYASQYHGFSYRRSAFRMWAWTYLLQGDVGKYREIIKNCLIYGDDNRDSDKQATKEAESGNIPDTTLLKARLLFDGGYYQRAAEELLQQDTQHYSERNKLEYVYRLGRIYDEWGKTDMAIKYYRMCIAMGSELPYYFAANSALHLGYIYEIKGDTNTAKQLYEQCLDMDFDEYQNSITQKAKAALERLED